MPHYELYNYFTDTVASNHRSLDTACRQYQRDFVQFYKHNTKNTHFCYVIREIQGQEVTGKYDGDGMRIE